MPIHFSPIWDEVNKECIGQTRKNTFQIKSTIVRKLWRMKMCLFTSVNLRQNQLEMFRRVWGKTLSNAQCVLCKVRCHCIFSGPGIRYSGIFCVPGICSGYSDILWHILVVDTVTYFGGNHGSRVWKSLKLEEVYFLRTRTSCNKYIFNRIVFFKF